MHLTPIMEKSSAFLLKFLYVRKQIRNGLYNKTFLPLTCLSRHHRGSVLLLPILKNRCSQLKTNKSEHHSYHQVYCSLIFRSRTVFHRLPQSSARLHRLFEDFEIIDGLVLCSYLKSISSSAYEGRYHPDVSEPSSISGAQSATRTLFSGAQTAL